MFNEEERVAESFVPLIEFISDCPDGSRLVFVDDGSTDRTVDVVNSRLKNQDPRRVEIHRRAHAGKGAAVRFGLQRAATDIAAFCDVDLATPLGELARIAEHAAAGSCLAIGSRASRDAKIRQHEERRREVAGKAFNRLVRTWLCPGIADTQCGAKAAPSWVWQTVLMHSREDGFAWDVEVIGLALRLGVGVHEVGIEWVHDDRTRVRVVHDGVSMVSALPRIGRTIHQARRSQLAAAPVMVPATDRALG